MRLRKVLVQKYLNNMDKKNSTHYNKDFFVQKIQYIKSFEFPSSLKLVLVILLFLTSLNFLIVWQHDRAQKIEEQKQEARRTFNEGFFKDMTLQARGVEVLDLSTGESLYSKNSQKPMALASITKLMTALVVLDHRELNETITLTDEDIKKEGGNGLTQNEVWNLKDLLGFTLVVSSNDGAHALARTTNIPEGSFVDVMNQTAQKIGLSSMTFSNESGLDVNSSENGGYASAHNVAELAGYAYNSRPDIFEITTHSLSSFVSKSGVRHPAQNTNTLAESIPNLRLSKTGYTDLAGGNLVIVFEPIEARPIAISVLGSTEQARFSDMKELVFRVIKRIQAEGQTSVK